MCIFTDDSAKLITFWTVLKEAMWGHVHTGNGALGQVLGVPLRGSSPDLKSPWTVVVRNALRLGYDPLGMRSITYPSHWASPSSEGQFKMPMGTLGFGPACSR